MIEIFASGGVLFIFDQWSKRVVSVDLANRHISVGRILRLRCVPNLRGAYKRVAARAAFVLIWLVALLSAMILYRSGFLFRGHLALVGLGLALGGAAGNLCDVLWRHYVVDFIDLRWWPAFNLADVAIICGLLLAFGTGT